LITSITTRSSSAQAHALQRISNNRWSQRSIDGAPSGRTWSARERTAAAAAVAEIVVGQIEAGIPADTEEAIRQLAEAISAGLVTEVSDALKAPERREKVAGHFWCSILAAICKAFDDSLDMLQKGVDEGVDTIMDALRSRDDGAEGRGATVRSVVLRARQGPVDAFADDLLDQVVRALVKKALTAIVDAVRELGEDTAIKYVRLIGMLVCPDAGAHPAVVRYCIWSLISGPFKEQVAEDLRSWIGAQYLRLQPAA
jgi:hypothetical protein